jgi:hypothetical protein
VSITKAEKKMRNKLSLFVLLVLAMFLLSSCGSNEHESKAKRKKPVKYNTLTQEKKEDIKARKLKVKDRKTISSFYTKSGKVSQRGFLVEEKKYDESGNLTEHLFYESDGSIDRKYIYKYDEQGNQIERVSYDFRGRIRYKKTSEYDKFGNEIFAKELDIKTNKYNKIFFNYDTAGNLISALKYNDEGELIHKTLNEYDKSGNLIRVSYFNEQGQKYSETQFKYDSLGNKILEILLAPGSTPKYKRFKYDSRGNLIYLNAGYFSQKFAYDEKDNEILEELFDKDGYLQQKFTTQYDNATGLMSSRVRYDGQNNPALFIKYQYEFYK